ncbi:MAG: alpha/beta fold hydrolase [Prolixibacteraceae bacterium]|jgi:esterase|nr:alpha/beta fold hydrolase [Prolixibacteraceae bacterium]
MNLFYRIEGEGEPLVILHGLYGSSDNWMSIARKLSDKYKVISVDLRNHGASPHDSSHTYNDMVTDIAWLFHELKLEQAHILGHSMGGKTAIAFAADYPEKTRSLIVADIAPTNYLKNPASSLQYDFHKNILETLQNTELSEFKTRKEIDQHLSEYITQKFVRQFILKNLHRHKGNYEWKINVKALLANLSHIISGVDSDDFDDRIPILKYPVLFIKGELSGYIDEESEKSIKKMYPEAKIETIEGASHLLHAEKPEAFIRVVSNFLSRS